MASPAAIPYRTEVFAPQGIVSASATTQDADVLARRERHASPTITPHRLVIQLFIDGKIIRFTYNTFDNGLPRWADPVLQSLVDHWGAQPGWNSYGAIPTNPQLVAKLLNVLSDLMHDESRSPQITPLADGGVQAEWHRQGANLEIVVPADEEATYYYFDRGTDTEEEAALGSNYTRVRSLIAEFA